MSTKKPSKKVLALAAKYARARTKRSTTSRRYLMRDPSKEERTVEKTSSLGNDWLVRVVKNGRTEFVRFGSNEAAARAFAHSGSTLSVRDPGRRGRRTQAEYLASITWNIKDAKEALANAVGMNDWKGVTKYTRQIEALEQKLRKSEHPGMKRTRGRGMSQKYIAGHRFGRGELPGGSPSKRYQIEGAHGEILWSPKGPQVYYSRAKAEAAFAKLRREHGPLPSGVRLVERTGPESPPRSPTPTTRDPAKGQRNPSVRFKIGDRVRTTMGIRQSGKVIPRFPYRNATDGTYREPEPHEKAVWVSWDDGTKGWSHRAHLEKIIASSSTGQRDPAKKRGPSRKHPKVKEYPSKHGKRDAGTLWVIWGPVSLSWGVFQGPDPFSPGGARLIATEQSWAEADRFAKGFLS